MKKFFKHTSIICFLMIGLTACLDLQPIDKNSTTGFNQDAVFAKCYASLALSGQQGATGQGDVDDIDEGQSSFYRITWYLNEFPTEEGWWIWANDPGHKDVLTHNWNGDNILVKGLYYRLNINIRFCNHFLARTEGLTDEKTIQQRAEVRFLRALYSWYLLDMFNLIPFNEKESSELPKFKTRPQMYEWLVQDLENLIKDLPEKRINQYRVDKYAAWLLLARVYLNAEVYTGTPAWADAQVAAEEALKGPYKLHTNGFTTSEGWYYSAYQQLFMGDNRNNGAQDEALLLIYQDGAFSRSYSGQMIIAATRDNGFVKWGSDANWKCFRTSPEFVDKFTKNNGIVVDRDTIKANEYEMPKILSDDRAIFCSQYTSSDGTVKSFIVDGSMGVEDAGWLKCWAAPKFTNVYSKSKSPADSEQYCSDKSWPDVNIPLFRLAEAYMIKAEALLRQGKEAEALDIINNEIRKRANATPLDKLDEATLCDEWCREFYQEGRRRSDLVRFNRFAGPKADAAAYNWEGRNGSTSTAGYKTMEEKFNWYPIPNDDKASNANYKEVPGGDGY